MRVLAMNSANTTTNTKAKLNDKLAKFDSTFRSTGCSLMTSDLSYSALLRLPDSHTSYLFETKDVVVGTGKSTA
jgi:hypothetical protein